MDHTPAFLALVTDAKTRIKETNIEGYRELMAREKPPLVIDVREESEYAAGHAKGARHLSKGLIERDIERTVPDKATPMVLYCGGGYRSALASDALGKMGYTGVISLDGGWHAYEASGLEIEK